MRLSHCTLEELDDRAHRAEHQMNVALEQRRWNIVTRYREEMLAVAAECDRRLRDDAEVAEPAS